MVQKRKLFFLLIFFFNIPARSEESRNHARRKRIEDNHRTPKSPSYINSNIINSDKFRYITSEVFSIGDFDSNRTPFNKKSNDVDNLISKRRYRRKVASNRRSREDSSVTSTQPKSSSADEERKQSGSKSQIDHIISGIVKLLKGNVKLKAPQSSHEKISTFQKPVPVSKTRINNRGPPRLPGIPFNILEPESEITRPPVWSSTLQSIGNDTDRLHFTANTKPPFLIPFPHNVNPIPITDRPLVTGFPIPEDLFSNASTEPQDYQKNDVDVTTAVMPSFTSPSNENSLDKNTNNSDSKNQSIIPTPSLESSSSKEKISSTKSSNSVNIPVSSTVVSVPLESEDSPSVTSTTTSSVKLSKVTPQVNLTVPSITRTTKPKSRSKSSTFRNTFRYSSRRSSSRRSSSYLSTLKPSITRPTISTRHPSFPSRLPEPIHRIQPTGHPGVVYEEEIGTSTYSGEVITANHLNPYGHNPSVFDVTVSALQGYGAKPPAPSRTYNQYNVNDLKTKTGLITSGSNAGAVDDGSVFIDGRKTYFDLQPATPSHVHKVQTMGIGTVIPEDVPSNPGFEDGNFIRPAPPKIAPTPPTLKTKPSLKRRKDKPALEPPRRIDTCIVGYDTTCNEDLGEVCRTEGDVSSCFCRPGTARRRPRTKCQKSVLLHMSMKVDRVGARRIVWGINYVNPRSKEYKELFFEATRALDSAFSQSKGMSELYLDSHVNKFYSLGGRVIVNSSVSLLHTPQTVAPGIRINLQRHLIKVIQANQNYIGDSKLAVEGPLNPIPDVSDVNECFDSTLHDCGTKATCSNEFGTFSCECQKGFSDRYPDDPDKVGRFCDSCPRDFCNKRGECRIEKGGAHVCHCEDSYYGSRCELDGEVIAVAVGASVAAVVIIVITLIFLCMWSQRWKAQDQKTEFVYRHPGGIFGNFLGRRTPVPDQFPVNVQQKGPPSNASSYGVSLEDRIRWAQMADTMAQPNIYSKGNKSCSKAGQKNWGSLKDILGGLFYRRGQETDGIVPRLTPEEALTLHQMITNHRQKNATENAPDQFRSTGFYQDQRKGMGSLSPSEYASNDTMRGLHPQNFGMQHMNPPSLYSQYPTTSKPPSTIYGHYGAPSVGTIPSVGGISRAPTLGARTPLPIQDLLGGTTLGPAGGGFATKKDGFNGALLMESSEEEHERPYHLPRPKSRSSVLDNDDIYFEPDDVTVSPTGNRFPPKPTKPPPPVPFFHFDQFYKNNIS